MPVADVDVHFDAALRSVLEQTWTDLEVVLALNGVALSYGSTNVVSFLSLAKIFGIWAAVSLPLAVCGTISGRRFGSAAGPPLRVNPVARHGIRERTRNAVIANRIIVAPRKTMLRAT
jgi:hypothetical protein